MESCNINRFKVFTVGWEPNFIDYLISPISEKIDFDFVHELIGDSSSINEAESKYSRLKFLDFSIAKKETLQDLDHELLASLECIGVPTIRAMVQGDRVLRTLPANEALAYASQLARSMREKFKEHQPDVVLASFDSLHSGLSLAVAKSLGIPWVAMTFTVIPDNLTGFCRGLTPDDLVPIQRDIDDKRRSEAKALIEKLRSNNQKILAFRPPQSISQWVRQYFQHVLNLIYRIKKVNNSGVNKFKYPSVKQRVYDITRRLVNRSCLPSKMMLQMPPHGRYIYFPLHMLPESSIDTWAPFYQDQIAFVRQLSLAIPADTLFVIKLHFSDPDNYSRKQLKKLMGLPQLKIVHPSAPGNVFIEKAALVVGIQGTACLEAALLAKPVLIFGNSPYQHFPRTERAKRPEELYGQICRMLDQSPATDDEIIEAYAAYIARYMPGRINDWTRPITENESELLADCFRALASYVCEPDRRMNWYKTEPFST